MQPAIERRALRSGQFEVPVRWAGAGRPVVYLHDALGPGGEWESGGPLARLAEEYLVLAPSHPGFEDATGLEQLEDVLDLTLYYLDFLDELLLDSPYLIGHGFGGLIAAEMAALAPRRIAKLVLIAPYGLRLEHAPIADIFAMAADDLARAVGPLVGPESTDDPDSELRRAQHLAATERFLRPGPDRGLRKRLYRLVAPTLLVWGERDPIIPPIYGEAFREQLAYARLVTLPEAGHAAHLEQPKAFARAVLDFLDG